MLHLLLYLRENSALIAINSAFGTQTKVKENKRKYLKEIFSKKTVVETHTYVCAREETPPPPPTKNLKIEIFFFRERMFRI